MITVKEIKDMHMAWCSGRQGDVNVLGGIFEIVRDLAERIERLEAPVQATVRIPTCWTEDKLNMGPIAVSSTSDDTLRQGRIDALEWCCSRPWVPLSILCLISEAIKRLKAGGEM